MPWRETAPASSGQRLNRDGRLNPRELRGAWDALKAYDADGDGAVAPEEIARLFQVTLTEGAGGGVVVPVPQLAGAPAPAAPGRGPLWFQRMDANGDGYVSAREFLGAADLFRRLDANGDGVLDPEEAERADALARGGKQ